MVDFNLKPGEPTINSDIDCIIQQIDILFETKFGDLLGDAEYGTDYERFLYELKVSDSVLSEQMMRDLAGLDLRGYTPTVKTYLMKGTERDIALIKVDLHRYNSTFTKIYRID